MATNDGGLNVIRYSMVLRGDDEIAPSPDCHGQWVRFEDFETLWKREPRHFTDIELSRRMSSVEYRLNDVREQMRMQEDRFNGFKGEVLRLLLLWGVSFSAAIAIIVLHALYAQ